jgi:hypothetical protein
LSQNITLAKKEVLIIKRMVNNEECEGKNYSFA